MKTCGAYTEIKVTPLAFNSVLVIMIPLNSIWRLLNKWITLKAWTPSSRTVTWMVHLLFLSSISAHLSSIAWRALSWLSNVLELFSTVLLSVFTSESAIRLLSCPADLVTLLFVYSTWTSVSITVFANHAGCYQPQTKLQLKPCISYVQDKAKWILSPICSLQISHCCCVLISVITARTHRSLSGV